MVSKIEKSTIGIGLSILIGISGLWIGYNASTSTVGIHRTKFSDSTGKGLIVQDFGIYAKYEPLNTSIYVEQGESLYIFFTSQIAIKQDTGLGQISFCIAIDGYVNRSLKVYFQHTDPTYQYESLVLQTINNTLSVGMHTVDIYYNARDSSAQTYYSTLLVQTIK
ncbi:MAG: hypothetical protein GY870_12980 [archaeon]|nr:hypothetical protein [archaeon]